MTGGTRMEQWTARTELLSAWHKLGADCGPILGVQLIKGRPEGSWSSTHRVVCKVRFKMGGAAIAKRCSQKKAKIEEAVYHTLLCGVRSELVRTPRYYGAMRESRGEQWWMFTEELKGRSFNEDNAADRALAAQWLATVHGHAATKKPPPGFPDGCHLRARSRLTVVLSGLDDIRDKPGASEAQRRIFSQLAQECERVVQGWKSIEELCGRFPHTLVHGDFVPKNLRICHSEFGNSLGVFDWGSSGWGAPATDLVRVDLETYRQALGDSASDSGRHLKALRDLGLLYRCVAAVYWELAHLRSSSFPGRSVANLAAYLEGIRSVRCDLSLPKS